MRDSSQQLSQGSQFFRADQLRMQGLQFDGERNVGREPFDVAQLERMDGARVAGRSQPDAAEVCASIRTERNQYFFAAGPLRIWVFPQRKQNCLMRRQ